MVRQSDLPKSIKNYKENAIKMEVFTMQNSFTTIFSKISDAYITTEQLNEILDDFSYERPSNSVYKITGVRGTGKTVILAEVV